MRNDLSGSSRLWIYQAERDLQPQETEYLNTELAEFCISWTAHDQKLKAGHDILHNRFIVLSVDESMNDASGCSIDKSTRHLKELSQHLGIDFFNRLQMAYLSGSEVKTLALSEIEEAIQQGQINEDTLFFNTNINRLEQLDTEFLIPYKSHWINRKK